MMKLSVSHMDLDNLKWGFPIGLILNRFIFRVQGKVEDSLFFASLSVRSVDGVSFTGEVLVHIEMTDQ